MSHHLRCCQNQPRKFSKDVEAEVSQKGMLQRDLSEIAAQTAGVKPDHAAAASAVQKVVSREQFLIATATSPMKQSMLSPKKLDQFHSHPSALSRIDPLPLSKFDVVA
jgi:hypothetical protein